MTTTVPPSTRPAGQRLLRRSRTDRLGAGVAGGLGEYFGLDPVLFRVLFAVAAFFGGAGILAYLLAWAVMPEAGTDRAAIDGAIGELRRRRVPLWAVAVVAALIFWAVAFSWWAPGPFFPVVAVVVLLILAVSRGGRRTPVPDPPAEAPVSLSKETTSSATWLRETREWVNESRAAGRRRRARALPVLLTTLLTAVLAVIGLAIADAVSGIAVPLYFWTVGAILLAGLLTGIALRRTPVSLVPLLLPVLAGMIAFGNTSASLHDGVGQREYAPISAATLASDYRLGFGQTVLDLRHLGTLASARTVNVTSAAGQVKVLLPVRMNATVHANVRCGEVEVDGRTVADNGSGSFYRTGGYDIGHDVLPPAQATGAPLTVNVHLADGQIAVDRT